MRDGHRRELPAHVRARASYGPEACAPAGAWSAATHPGAESVAGQGYRPVLDRRPALSETLFQRLRETRMEL